LLSKRSTLNSKVSSFAVCVLLAVSAQSLVVFFAQAQAQPQGQDKNTAVKKAASLNDPPIGSKSREDLMRRLSKAYDTHNDSQYLSLFKASLVQKLRLQTQFDRDSAFIARNFRCVTVDEEKARLKARPPANTSADKKAASDGKKSDNDKRKALPIIGYVDFDLKAGPDAPPLVIGLPLVQTREQAKDQAKELYYLTAL
jgi:hypothetical protein